ncbi:MAG: leucine-rich repeat protein, partial [Clostridia bacterium]|nr:leucine-rich repeat protein [Clostridia bacterium]
MGCTSLEEVVIGGNYTAVSRETFYDCNKLTSITLPSSIEELGYGAF